MASPLIELKNIQIGWPDKVLLKNINLQVQQGEAVVIIGPSGEGKTSVLKCIAGLLPPQQGEVLIQGESLYDERGRENSTILQKMGMLFQKNALFDSLTVADNLKFPMTEVTSLSLEQIQTDIDGYLDSVGLLEHKHKMPSELSGGMQKRLGIARAISLKPEITIYDDPVAGLDPITSRKIVQLIISLQEGGHNTSVSVINDMNRVRQLASRVLFVCDGELLDCGTPGEMDKHPDARVQQFINGQLDGPLLGV